MSGPNPQELIAKGADLCFKCHPKKKEDFKKKSVHKAMEEGCTVCHTPHAADVKGLILGKERALCIKCHGDIQEQISRAVSIHPVKAGDGRCSICHDPHASQEPNLMVRDSIELCKKCHEKHAEFSHPYGQGVIDPRNNKIITCLSCHGPHGTQYPAVLLYDSRRALCIQCHRPEEMEKGPMKPREPKAAPKEPQEGPPRPARPQFQFPRVR
jgi:predicted CXXCH cytochrome family protein